MAWGGRREGAGRKQGSRLQKTAAIAHKLAEEGITPLEYILGLMRDETLPLDIRLDCAKAAAAYVHPRLAATHTLSEKNVTISMNDVVRKALEDSDRMYKEMQATRTITHDCVV